EPVDDRLVARKSEHARLRVSGLRARSGGTDFDETEAEGGQRVDVRAVLVQSGGEPDRVVEAQAEAVDGQGRGLGCDQRMEAGAPRGLDRGEREVVRALGVEAEEEGAGEGIHAAF